MIKFMCLHVFALGSRRKSKQITVRSSARRKRRSQVEGLECRALLAAITEYPIPTTRQTPRPCSFRTRLLPDRMATSGSPRTHRWRTVSAKITPSGQVTVYSRFRPLGSNPFGITVGPDGNLWFTDPGTDSVGQITTSGTVTEYTLPSIIANPTGIVTGPDGNLWVTEDFYGEIAKISPEGQVLAQYPVPGTFPQPDGIAVGPDGNLWFADQGGQNIGELNISTAQ